MCPIESHQTLHRCIFLSPGSRAPQSLAVPPAARAPPSILFCFDLPAKVSSLEYLETAVEPDTAGVLFVRSPLVLTERIEHLQCLAQLLSPDIPNLILLQGGQSKKELTAARARLAELPATAARVILATGKYIGEGFDDSRLDTLFLALPISWRGTIAQYGGGLHRLHESKREVRVYDYADLNVAMLSRMFDKRCRGYEALGYTILLPGSALPGWPPDVPLPIDPEWKRDYAASVRRLIRDGVDVPLANLFVHVARSPGINAVGEERARSASEWFLFRRRQTLPQTAGRFRLNMELPISFDGHGQMEVDFLCVG